MNRLFTSLPSLLWLATISSSMLWAEVSIDIDIATQFQEQAPINATVIVSHGKNEKIDLKSFKLDNQPLQVEFQGEEQMTATGDLVLSMYRFTLPPQPKGLHILPGMKVTVANKVYQSVPRTYEVKGTATAQPSRSYVTPSTRPSPPASSATPSNYLLKLEAFISGPQELYPGQRTIVGYRYFYNTSLDTTREVLPLLEAEGLIKVGDKSIKERESQGVSVLQIEQMVEGHKPGEYAFGPSILEGRPYQADQLGRRVYSKQILSSSVPSVPLSVKPFPEANKPPSFKGAVGNFVWQVSLNSPSTINIGDEIDLLIEVTGKGNLDSVNIPELCCQPGMSGLFDLSNLPPVGEIAANTKRFHVKLKPLSNSIKAIPQLEFSSFDPEVQKYLTSYTQPIALKVLPSPQKETTSEIRKSPSSEPLTPAPISTDTTKPVAPLQAEALAADIEIESLYPLKVADLYNLTLGTWWSLLLIPFCIAAILFQLNLQEYLSKLQLKPKITTSDALFSQALAASLGSSRGQTLLSQALLLRLKENGEIPSADIAPDKLSPEGTVGEVRALLCEMQERRYAGKELPQDDDLLHKTRLLFEKLQSLEDMP